MPAAFSMVMLASTMSGDVYTFPELSEMHSRAEFRDVTKRPISLSLHTIVAARGS